MERRNYVKQVRRKYNRKWTNLEGHKKDEISNQIIKSNGTQRRKTRFIMMKTKNTL